MERLRFKGSLRDYQQRVLDRAQEYLADGKVHIVAAPGSGKTVLGLELIRRLGAPCVVFAPTTAIREQWGKRLKELFLPDRALAGELLSDDLKTPRALTCVTYQALFSAMAEPGGRESLLAGMKEAGVGTVCLDEAHHLTQEWHRALEAFLEGLAGQIKVIALTATPPYDAPASEWERYIRLCGQIDEEVFVPELVGKGNLCPHQDYVYLNYPTKEEAGAITAYREAGAAALAQAARLPFAQDLEARLLALPQEELFAAAREHTALLILMQAWGLAPCGKLIRRLTGVGKLPEFHVKYGQRALRWLCEGGLLHEQEKEQLIRLCKAHGLWQKGRVELELNEKLRRTLLRSAGKLDSILQITRAETETMGDGLRLLILTDHIRKEQLARLETIDRFGGVHAVSIFETLRRQLPGAKLAVLSGSLVILPGEIEIPGVIREPIGDTGYVTVTFPGGVREAVAEVSALFEQGLVQILIGTKSLLGEGWDSPCINALILASFVGSYMLSNQMRGRAIRTDPRDPEKTANIWHLVTLEPEHLIRQGKMEQLEAYLTRDHQQLDAWDYELLERRFDAFMGPRYDGSGIESGIQRVTALEPPFDPEGIRRINERMLNLSANRARMARCWRSQVGDGRFTVEVQTQLPPQTRVPPYLFINGLAMIAVGAAGAALIGALGRQGAEAARQLLPWMLVVLTLVLAPGIRRLILHLSPVRSMQALGNAVYQTLAECGLIQSSCKVKTLQAQKGMFLAMCLRNASLHDQNLFNTAMTQLLSPIDNPRYLIIGKNGLGKRRLRLSFACPAVIAARKEYVQVLTRHLHSVAGRFEAVYTRNPQGRQLILACRARSYIGINRRAMDKTYRLTRWD